MLEAEFENVDVEQCLRSVMERNTKHYQSDFEFDVGSMERIAQTKHPERTPLYWMSRPSGTWCFGSGMFLSGIPMRSTPGSFTKIPVIRSSRTRWRSPHGRCCDQGKSLYAGLQGYGGAY